VKDGKRSSGEFQIKAGGPEAIGRNSRLHSRKERKWLVYVSKGTEVSFET